MLKVPQLDDITYEQMMQRAIGRIPAMTEEWTDFNSHDPGITVLQTYAWLTDMLNFYMNATGDVHVQKYLKLLGIEPESPRASESYVILENVNEPVRLTRGTRFYAGSIPFELEEDSIYQYNAFCSYIQEADGKGMDLTAFAGNDGDYADAFPCTFSERASLYFGFEKPLQDGDRLYLRIRENKKRNLFGEDFSLCSLSWEYYTKEGWKSLDIKDETCGFLKSGFLEVHLSETPGLWSHPDVGENAYYIRCTLEENHYDSMPQLGKIYVNPMKVVQKATLCPMGEIRPELEIGKTDGCAGQELQFDCLDVYCFSLALCKEEDTMYELWTMTEHLEEADYKDRVFFYDREKRRVCFGDGIHGMVPEQKLTVYVTGLEVSRLSQGNVLAGEIRDTDREELAGCQVYNPVASSGGRDQESIPDMMKRLEDTLFTQNRMVSEADYEQIILNTPGLMLDLVHVIPGSIYGELYRQDRSPNEIMVIVKPYSEKIAPELSADYRQRIEQHIESFRLLNTKVTIVSPAYAGIEVNGKIELNHDTPEAREKVQERIREMISYQGKEKPFGNEISYGRLFTSLEAMEEVKRVRELALEKNGSAAVKNDRGDILCQEDALSYVEQFHLEFC